jgi:hypothetical protein
MSAPRISALSHCWLRNGFAVRLHCLRHVLALLLLLPITYAAAFAFAAQPAAGRVMLATVSDRNNRPTVDVGPDDFVVEEGNDEREVLAVRVADYPVAVLIDNGGETAPIIAALRRAAGRFVTRIGQRPVTIGTLAEPVQIVANFDDDRQHVLDGGLRASCPARRRDQGRRDDLRARHAVLGGGRDLGATDRRGRADPV